MEGRVQTPKREEFPRPTVALEDVKTPEDFFNAVDFQTLRDIFSTIARKSGVESGDMDPRMQTFDRDSIDTAVGIGRSPESTFLAAEAHHDTARITVYWNTLEQYNATIETQDVKIPIGLNALHMLAHEMAHLYSRKVTWPSPATEDLKALTKGKGFADFRQLSEKEGVVRVYGQSLDEAVTEEVGIDVFNEYLKRTGLQGVSEETRRQLGGVYLTERVILSEAILSLAQNLEVDRDTIWRGIVQEYFNGTTRAMELINDIVREAGKNWKISFKLMGLAGEIKGVSEEEIGDKENLLRAVTEVEHRMGRGYMEDALGLR